MVLKLYYLSASPPARAALLGIRNLGLSVELVDVDLFKQEHLTPEFKRINPAHQVPVLDDDGFILSESRAILGYLVNRYQSGSTLYPTDARMRAVVDQRLYFDTTVFQRNCIAIVAAFQPNPVPVPKDVKEKIQECMEVLDGFAEKSLWFAGDLPTIADLSILANVSQIKACGYKISNHENLNRWYEMTKTLPGFEENDIGAEKFGEIYRSIMGNPFETI